MALSKAVAVTFVERRIATDMLVAEQDGGA